MGFPGVRTKASGRLQSCFGLRQVRGVVVQNTVNVDLREGELAIYLEELWITRQSLLQQIGRLQQIGSPISTGKRCQKKIFRVRVEIKRGDIRCRRLFNGTLLAR